VEIFLNEILKSISEESTTNAIESLQRQEIHTVGDLRLFDYNELVQMKIANGIAKKITVALAKGNLAFNTS
jgi:hypothetical protein